MTKTAFSGDNILSEEEIIKGADKCLRLLMSVPVTRLTTWEQGFLASQEGLNQRGKACSYKELIKLRELVGKYAQ